MEIKIVQSTMKNYTFKNKNNIDYFQLIKLNSKKGFIISSLTKLSKSDSVQN